MCVMDCGVNIMASSSVLLRSNGAVSSARIGYGDALSWGELVALTRQDGPTRAGTSVGFLGALNDFLDEDAANSRFDTWELSLDSSPLDASPRADAETLCSPPCSQPDRTGATVPGLEVLEVNEPALFQQLFGERRRR
jgi:hypothetical protein